MSGLVGAKSCTPEIVRTSLQFDVVENFADGAPERLPGPGGGIPEPVIDLGECPFDRVQVRSIRRQDEQVRAGRTDRPRTFGFFTGEATSAGGSGAWVDPVRLTDG